MSETREKATVAETWSGQLHQSLLETQEERDTLRNRETSLKETVSSLRQKLAKSAEEERLAQEEKEQLRSQLKEAQEQIWQMEEQADSHEEAVGEDPLETESLRQQLALSRQRMEELEKERDAARGTAEETARKLSAAVVRAGEQQQLAEKAEQKVRHLTEELAEATSLWETAVEETEQQRRRAQELMQSGGSEQDGRQEELEQLRQQTLEVRKDCERAAGKGTAGPGGKPADRP